MLRRFTAIGLLCLLVAGVQLTAGCGKDNAAATAESATSIDPEQTLLGLLKSLHTTPFTVEGTDGVATSITAHFDEPHMSMQFLYKSTRGGTPTSTEVIAIGSSWWKRQDLGDALNQRSKIDPNAWYAADPA